MSKYFCKNCWRGQFIFETVDTHIISLTAGQYLEEKFIKHTSPLDYNGTVSVYFETDYMWCLNHTVSGIDNGLLEIDHFGRKNIIWKPSYSVGWTFENGIYQHTDNSIKIVRSDVPSGIHSFPYFFDIKYQTCEICGRPIQ